MKTLLSWFRGTSAVAKVLVGVWLLTVCGLVVWGIDLALGSDVGSAAGLWQVAVELFGFPLLLYGLLHELPQQLDKARRKPILSIWPSFPYVPITHRVGIENPPNVIQVPDWKPSPTLIIMNQGNAITRVCYALCAMKVTKRCAISMAKATKCSPTRVSDKRS